MQNLNKVHKYKFQKIICITLVCFNRHMDWINTTNSNRQLESFKWFHAFSSVWLFRCWMITLQWAFTHLLSSRLDFAKRLPQSMFNNSLDYICNHLCLCNIRILAPCAFLHIVNKIDALHYLLLDCVLCLVLVVMILFSCCIVNGFVSDICFSVHNCVLLYVWLYVYVIYPSVLSSMTDFSLHSCV